MKPGRGLIGREAELATVRAAVADAAASGRFRGVLIEAEAGMGGSALVDVAVAAAADAGFTVLRCRGDDLARATPFHPIRQEGWPVAASPDDEAAFSDAVVDLVEAAALRGPTIVAAYHLEWADIATIDALRLAVLRTFDVPVVFVASTRRLGNEAAERLAEAIADAGGTHLRLEPLDTPAVDALVERETGARCGPRLAAVLGRAGGIPLAVIELLHAFQREGRIEVTSGVAEVHGEGLPSSLRDGLLRRLDTFAPEELEVLHVAAVLGRSCQLDELAAVAGRSVPDVLHDLRRSLATGVLERRGTGLRFSHELLRDALEESLGDAMRAALHAEAAVALSAGGAAPERVARQLVAAGGAAPVALAGDVAWELRRDSPALALDVCERVRPAPSDDADRLEVARLWPLVTQGRLTEAELTARGFLTQPCPPDTLAEIGWCLVAALQRQGRVAEGHDELVRLLERRDLPLPSRRMLEARLPIAILLTGDVDGAAAAGERAMATGESEGDVDLQLGAMTPVVMKALAIGDVRRGVEIAERCDRLVRSSTTPAEGLGLLLPSALVDADRFDDARAALRRAAARDQSLGDRSVTSVYDVWDVVIDAIAGAWDDALAVADRTIEVLRAHGGTAVTGLYAFALPACIHLHRGRLDVASEYLSIAERALEERGPQNGADFVLWAKALLLEAQGAPVEAAALLALEWDLTVSVRYLLSWRCVAPDLVRLSLAVGDRARAEAVTHEAEEGASRAPGVASAAAAALRCRAHLDNDADAARAAVDALRPGPRRPELAAALEEAAALVGQRDPPAGIALLRDARAELVHLGAARDLARVDASLAALGAVRPRRPGTEAVAGWESLTPREAEVVELVTQGLTNAQVAARLYLSRHTVESHLKRVYLKLGVASRAELTARAARRNT